MLYPNIRALREDRDLKQRQLAELLHVSQNTYSQYETGVIALTAERSDFCFAPKGLCPFGAKVKENPGRSSGVFFTGMQEQREKIRKESREKTKISWRNVLICNKSMKRRVASLVVL